MEYLVDAAPGFWVRLYMRWRIWRRDAALMELIARGALVRCGVCDESDSLVRCLWDRDSRQLVVMIYLAQFDHAVWAMSRHLEFYLRRQFKGLYGIDLHSVHFNVIRSRAFKGAPPLKSATAVRAVLRERRRSGVKSTGITGTKISRVIATREEVNAFAPTMIPGDGNGFQERRSRQSEPEAPVVQQRKGRARDALRDDEYLSVPGYEISEVGFDEFLSSLPSSSMPDISQPSPLSKEELLEDRNSPAKGSVHAAPFVAEADLMKREKER